MAPLTTRSQSFWSYPFGADRPQLLLNAGQFTLINMTALILHLGRSLLRKPGSPRYVSHVFYGGHNAIPHNNTTILREVDPFLYPLSIRKLGHAWLRSVQTKEFLSIYSGVRGVLSPALSPSSPMLRDCLSLNSRQEY